MSRRDARRDARRGSRVVRVVVLMVVGALALSGCDFSVYSLPLPGGADLGDNPYTVKVEFRDVMDLVPQSSVKVDDVTVGKVDDDQGRRLPRRGDRAAAPTASSCPTTPSPRSARPACWARSSSRWPRRPPAPATAGSATATSSRSSRTGRNPEVEEVLGALSLLLNGGGVAQLKTISTELNKALGGREAQRAVACSPSSTSFMGQLDTNKDQIVRAIESLNRLAIALNKQKPAITPGPGRAARARSPRSTGSATTWSRCSRRSAT